jgi:hypothetical protein
LKYLVIACLFALLLLLLYARIRPYLLALQKLLTAARNITEPDSAANSRRRAGGTTDSKLVRCVACGTWIPAERAIGRAAGGSVYCSRECLEKRSNQREEKLAG